MPTRITAPPSPEKPVRNRLRALLDAAQQEIADIDADIANVPLVTNMNHVRTAIEKLLRRQKRTINGVLDLVQLLTKDYRP